MPEDLLRRLPLRIAAVFGLAMTASPWLMAADASKPEEPETPKAIELSEESQQLADELKTKLPEGTEARAMLDAILTGAKMGPEDGWFPIATSQTRFTWETVAKRLDANDDQSISREEFPGPEEHFKRLDRDDSNAITEDDLKWSEHALARGPVTPLFYRGDVDGDGNLSRDEFLALFEQLDRDGTGQLCLDDLQEAFRQRSSGRTSNEGPTPEVLLKGLDRQEIGAWNAGPAVGEVAPDFTLRTVDGSHEVNLRATHRDKPLVLIFGNFTCGPFRAHSGNAERVYRRYQDQAEFLMVYVREAHPTDGWRMSSNDQLEIEIAQPSTDEERTSVAQRCQHLLKAPWPMLVDGIDDAVGRAYSGMPSRLYVIDREGVVAYKSGRGPFGFKPAELEQSLIWLLSSGEEAPQAQ